jgi:hypothetical protein
MYQTEQNPKLGFYTVGEKQIYNKVEALTEATKTGHFPEWNFSRPIFEQVAWDIEPTVPLQELYRQRAQQLREQYDWIRLEASGGGDSSTALYSFLLNGIHIDEVVFRYPKKGEKGVSNDPFNTKPQNTLSEWEYAAKPLLDWVKTHYPKVKITIHDYSEYILDSATDESWVYKGKDYFQLAHVCKHDAIAADSHRKDADSGKNICILYGIDKPKMCIRDGKWYVYFMDLQANHSNSTFYEYTNIINEYFYWTPDFPEIIHKQAHIIKNWFSLPQNKHLQYLVRWPNYSIAHRTAYEQMVKPLIYPDYDPATFQTSKPTNSFYNEMDYWFYANFKETQAYQIQKAGLDLLVNTIDPKYFNNELGKPVGFVGFLSPFYCLGEADYQSAGNNEFYKF